MIKLREFIQRAKAFINENPQRKKFLLIIFVLAIIPLTVIAALTVQDIRQRAGGTGVQIVDSRGNFLSTTSDTSVYLKINPPENWTGRGVGMNKNNLVNQAYAQTTGGSCSPPYQGFLGCFSSSDRPSGSACTSSCTTNSGQNGQYCYTSTVVGNSCTSSAGQKGICSEQGVCVVSTVSTPTPTLTKTSTPTPTFPTSAPTATPSAPSSLCNPACKSNEVCKASFILGTTSYSCFPNPATPTPTPILTPAGRGGRGIGEGGGAFESRVPTPTPIPNILQAIYIENKDSDGSINGSEPLRITSGFESYIGTQVPWRLNDLLPGQNQATRLVQVTFLGSQGTVALTGVVSLVRPSGPTNILSRVDISFDCTNQSPFPIQAQVGQECHGSALAYDTSNSPMYKDVTYSWGISSTNSIGTLNKTSGNITTFYAQNNGIGDIWVIAQKGDTQVRKGFKVEVTAGAINPPNSPTYSTPTYGTPSYSTPTATTSNDNYDLK